MIHIIHRLFSYSHPKCPVCVFEDQNEQSLECMSCDTLRVQLENANAHNRLLLHHIVEMTKPAEIQQAAPEEPREFKPVAHIKPWSVRRNELESASLLKAQELTKTLEDNLIGTRSENSDSSSNGNEEIQNQQTTSDYEAIRNRAAGKE